MAKKFSLEQIKLIRRYLIWFYKTSKEALDKVDRYYTQHRADDFVLAYLKKTREFRSKEGYHQYKTLIQGFEKYKTEKKGKADIKKFVEGKRSILSQDYLYLKNRFLAVEKTIQYFLGPKELITIRELYEQEMIKRIIEAREHS